MSNDEIIYAMLDSQDWNYFEGWSDNGYLIKKGSKATDVFGHKLFHKSQVMTKKARKGAILPDGLDIDDMSSFTGEPAAMGFFS